MIVVITGDYQAAATGFVGFSVNELHSSAVKGEATQIRPRVRVRTRSQFYKLGNRSGILAAEISSRSVAQQGRFALGMGVGGREDDFTGAGKDFSNRGARFDEQLDQMHSLWHGEVISDSGQASIPSPGESVRVMIGGTADKAVERTVRWAEGWTAGGAGPEQAAEFARKVREAWRQSGRKGTRGS